jgi:Domain of unknown function (DUF222)/HNH endonuclease
VRLVRGHEAAADALASGAVTVANLDAVANAAYGHADLYAEHEAVLLETATAVDPQDFAMVTSQWRAMADDEAARLDAPAAFERRAFDVSKTTDGAMLGGFLDPEAAAIVRRALDELAPPDPVDGPEPARSLSQRRADALVQLCRGDHEHRPAAGIDAVVDCERLVARSSPLSLDARCDLDGFGPVARVTLERLLCDCAIGRVIVQGRSLVLDYGRRTRIVPRRLRRLIALRDERRQFPGCRAVASWCDVHHLVPWHQGRATSERNCALLCRRHHVACHEGGWHLARGPDGVIAATRADALALAA